MPITQVKIISLTQSLYNKDISNNFSSFPWFLNFCLSTTKYESLTLWICFVLFKLRNRISLWICPPESSLFSPKKKKQRAEGGSVECGECVLHLFSLLFFLTKERMLISSSKKEARGRKEKFARSLFETCDLINDDWQDRLLRSFSYLIDNLSFIKIL